MMRTTVFGAGAIGGVIAAYLAQSARIGVVARGPHLEAIRADGLKLIGLDGGLHSYRVDAAADPRELEPADIVIVALKAYALPEAAEAIVAARKPGGLVVFVQNGLPWWYLRHRLGEQGRPFSSILDPEGKLDGAFPGCAAGVAYFGGAVPEPGTIHHVAGGKLLLGTADGTYAERLISLAERLSSAGLATEAVSDIGQAIWAKLAVNVALNSMAVLTEATIEEMLTQPHLRPVLGALIAEATQLAGVLGHQVSFDIEAQKRITRPGQKSSTLQDLEAGRPIEYDTLFGAVLDLAAQVKVPMLATQTVALLVKERARQSLARIASAEVPGS